MDLVVLLDDDLVIRQGFQDEFEFLNLDLELIVCSKYEEYNDIISDKDKQKRIRCFIMDLSNTQKEQVTHTFKASTYIENQYTQNRVPIFVHSAYLDFYDELSDMGTVFKISKGRDSTIQICQSIKLMKNSGFLDVFCIDGSLEKKIMTEIHSAFVEQFKSNEIEKIIDSVRNANSDNIVERTVEVFERIALRAVYQNVINNTNSAENVKVNAIEHYYRRSTKFLPFYTGDIFKCKDTEECIFVATPRCNISNGNFEELLLCKIRPISESQLLNFLNKKIEKDSVETKGEKSFRTSITDDVTNPFIGERFRFLPPVPSFEGGFVDFKNLFSLSQEDLNSKYDYYISLVDDLTNDVIRKMTTYLQRGGISDTHYLEAQYFLKSEE